MSNEILRREIIRTIMGNLGMIPKKDFGKMGIAKNDFKIPNSLDISYTKEYDQLPLEAAHSNNDIGSYVRKFPIYAASLMSETFAGSETKFRALCSSLDDDLVVVFRADKLPIYGLRLDYHASLNDEDWGRFLVKYDSKWLTPSLSDQLLACAGIEAIAQSLMDWEACDDYNDLMGALTELVEM